MLDNGHLTSLTYLSPPSKQQQKRKSSGGAPATALPRRGAPREESGDHLATQELCALAGLHDDGGPEDGPDEHGGTPLEAPQGVLDGL